MRKKFRLLTLLVRYRPFQQYLFVWKRLFAYGCLVEISAHELHVNFFMFWIKRVHSTATKNIRLSVLIFLEIRRRHIFGKYRRKYRGWKIRQFFVL